VVAGAGSPEAYARRALVNQATNRWRRRGRRLEVALNDHDVALPDRSDDALVCDVVVAALRELPLRQRAAVVLRFLEDLPVSEVARALDCSEGTVRSHTARGLDRLRTLSGRVARRRPGSPT
jgi:RNA polymerase sigma factor (sigma-70 family)